MYCLGRGLLKMKIRDQIKHECNTIINIVNLPKMNEIDAAQLNCCIRRLQELSHLYAIDYDTLITIGEC